jgi:quercetin 2,3-dioxygenase
MVRPMDVVDSHAAQVGVMSVRRALPRRARRTVGHWCFADHLGPLAVTEDQGPDVAPHPHIGLQTVTWLIAGEILHRDSLGSEQPIRPGQLNLMTAGHGVSHSEEHTGHYRGYLHGIQLWVAQPEATRHGPAAFEHHGALPRVELDRAVATVLVGDLGGTASPARRDTDHLGAELELRPGHAVVPVDPAFEHALIVADGALRVDGQVLTPGHLGYLGEGRDELVIEVVEPTRAMLLGGVPMDGPPLMFWNFVARTRDEIAHAYREWQDGDQRYGTVASSLARIPSPVPPWVG